MIIHDYAPVITSEQIAEAIMIILSTIILMWAITMIKKELKK